METTTQVKTIRFTPRNYFTGKRAEMQISQSDYDVMNANGEFHPRMWISAHDYSTGRNIKIRKAVCDMPGCRCDAVYKEIGE